MGYKNTGQISLYGTQSKIELQSIYMMIIKTGSAIADPTILIKLLQTPLDIGQSTAMMCRAILSTAPA
jgi:hypothetical protein